MKIYQLKKTQWFVYDGEKTRNYLENDDFSEEFYTSLKKAEDALVNYVKHLTGETVKPWNEIRLFPRKHFTVKYHNIVGRKYTLTTKWELIEIEPW